MEQHSLSLSNLNKMISNNRETRTSGSLTQRRLPNEIMTLIIHYLSEQGGTLYECALVSKDCHVIVNSFLWKVLDFRKIDAERFFAGLTDTTPKRLAILAKPIRQLWLTGRRLWTDEQLIRFAPHMPQLTHLNTFPCRITNTSLQYLLPHCPSLLSLSVDYLSLNDTDLAAIGQHWRQLRTLECKTHSHSPALELLTCPLEHLTINTSIELTEKAMATLQSFGLVSLNINGSACEQIMTLAWPQLTSVTLDIWDMPDDTLIRFLQSHPQLTHLGLTYPEELTKMTLDAITRCLPHLQSIFIHDNDRLSNDDVRHWVQQSPSSLTWAKFQHCGLSLNAFPTSQQSNHHTVYLDQATIDQIKSTAP